MAKTSSGETRKTKTFYRECHQDTCHFWSKCPYKRDITKCRLELTTGDGDDIEEID